MLPLDPVTAALVHIDQHQHARMIGRLRRAFPNTPDEAREDALQSALVDLLALARLPESAPCRALREAGRAGLERLLYQAAWRALRGELRRARARRERCVEVMPELGDGAHPLARLEARRAAQRLAALVPRACLRHAPRRADELRAALWDRMLSGDTDVEVAARHGVGRSQLCRARGWLEAEMAA